MPIAVFMTPEQIEKSKSLPSMPAGRLDLVGALRREQNRLHREENRNHPFVAVTDEAFEAILRLSPSIGLRSQQRVATIHPKGGDLTGLCLVGPCGMTVIVADPLLSECAAVFTDENRNPVQALETCY